MSNMLPFIIIGVTSGSVYGLAGVGLILTYKTSGIFNIAYGAVAAVGAFLFYALHDQLGIAWPVAAVIAVLVLGVLAGIGLESFARGISRAALIWRIVAMAGILVSIEAILTILYGSEERIFPSFLPEGTFGVAGVYVTWSQVIITSLSVLSAAILVFFFRWSRMGKAMRAVVDDPDLLDLTGTDPVRIRRWAWVIGTVFAMVCGLLLAPSVGLSASGLTLLVVEAFGAAAIGRFKSLPATWIGGVVIGIGASLITEYVSSTSILGGLSASLPFLVLFLVLLLTRRSRESYREPRLQQRPVSWQTPASVQLTSGAFVLIFLLTVPVFAGYRLFEWTLTLTYVILFLSLAFLARTSGQISLCHVTFAAIGAVAFSKLSVGAGIPWLPALVLAGLVAVPFGALVAIPAVRLSGLYLALATLGFGLLVQNMFYNSSLMFTTMNAGISLRMPHLSWLATDSQNGFYYLVLFIFLVLTVIVVALARTRMGRILSGLSDSPLALTANGANVAVTRVLAFCISAYLAAVAGALGGMVLQQVTGADYPPLTSLIYMAVIMIVIGGMPWNALAAGAGLGLLPAYIPSANTSNYLAATFGVAAVLAALGRQQGLLSMRGRLRVEAWGTALDTFWAGLRLGGRQKPSSAAATRSSEHNEPLSLEVRDLTVRFGGLVAVNKFSLKAPAGKITGLIGPNGAGKTTTFNACSGLVRTGSGRIFLNGVDVSRESPERRAQQGLGRTFQQVELLDSHSVLENIEMGREAALAGSRPLRHVFSRRGDRRAVSDAARAAAQLCGLDPVLNVEAGTLPTGQRRLVELARCLAGNYGLLLLDEPSSGLDRSETRAFGAMLASVVEKRGIAVLLVEHDMSLVMSICSEVFVMDFGQLIFRGSTSEVRNSEVVQSAYLGVEVVS
jgi:ABC-type branched-subunit amino acid transport system ATPase component/branched-subunit amino acid ABC-type transport system permease component